MRRLMIVLFLCCLEVPAGLSAETADDYLRHGMTLASKGEYDKAIAEYTKALAIAPKNALVYYNRGFAWYIKGERDKAITDCTKALAIDPNYAAAYSCRGSAWKEKGEYGKAIADYPKALAVNPKDYVAYCSLAEIYATCPDAKYRDGQKAFENASKAYRLAQGHDWGCVDALAAAYAESGDFAKAREFQAKAIDLATDYYKPQLRGRLELYKQGKPYHEPPVKK